MVISNGCLFNYGSFVAPNSDTYNIYYSMAYTNSESISVFDCLYAIKAQNTLYDSDLPSVFHQINTTYWRRASYAGAQRRWTSFGY